MRKLIIKVNKLPLFIEIASLCTIDSLKKKLNQLDKEAITDQEIELTPQEESYIFERINNEIIDDEELVKTFYECFPGFSYPKVC